MSGILFLVFFLQSYNLEGGIMEDSKKELSASELLEGVYNKLTEGARSIELSSETKAEIADDSDHHRTRVGYTAYESVSVLMVDNTMWMLGLGKTCGSYPADPYDRDIVAIQILDSNELSDADIDVKACNAFGDNIYFKNSLVYSMADGQLGVKEKGFFGEIIIRSLNKEINNFISRPLDVDNSRFYMDMSPVVKATVLYKPEFVDFLSKTFFVILKEKSVQKPQ